MYIVKQYIEDYISFYRARLHYGIIIYKQGDKVPFLSPWGNYKH